jgi:hypothetical protein
VPELIGPTEIARRFGVTPGAVTHWITRSQRGASSPLRPRFPPSHSGKLWSWPDVLKWGRKWQEYHPGALPALPVERDYLSQARDQARDDAAQYQVSGSTGCICTEGVVNLFCPVHT